LLILLTTFFANHVAFNFETAVRGTSFPEGQRDLFGLYGRLVSSVAKDLAGPHRRIFVELNEGFVTRLAIVVRVELVIF
jgi:hypothetical protein